jgi:hypothetical protein
MAKSTDSAPKKDIRHGADMNGAFFGAKFHRSRKAVLRLPKAALKREKTARS